MSHIDPQKRPARRGPHVPTLVVGLLGTLVAAGALLAHVGGVHVDPIRATPWAMLGVGLLLVGVGVLASRRGR